jgi:hypothetical protein
MNPDLAQRSPDNSSIGLLLTLISYVGMNIFGSEALSPLRLVLQTDLPEVEFLGQRYESLGTPDAYLIWARSPPCN